VIPRIIHFVWLQGIDAMPEDYRRCVDSWAPLHPGWEVKVWDRDTLPPLVNDWALDLSTPTLVCDILRYEFVFQYGGMFLDADHECCKPVDSLFNGQDGFVSMRNSVLIENSAFASVPGSTWLADVIAELGRNRSKCRSSVEIDLHYRRAMARHPEVEVLSHFLLQTMDTEQDRWKAKGIEPFAIHRRLALWAEDLPPEDHPYRRRIHDGISHGR
jgi:hypothetical protein